MYRDRSALYANGLPGINLYVPKMQFASLVNHGGITPFSLGSPAAVDADIVYNDLDGDGTAGTVTTINYTLDATYGRNLRVTPSADPGAAGGVFDVYGRDYLGQPMVERFTGANGSTAILYGKKAFKVVDYAVIITAATNAITFDIGTGMRLGLPYKGEVMWAKENGVYVPVNKHSVWQWADIAGAAVGGGPSGAWMYAPFPGYIKTLVATAGMPAGSTNDPAVTVELGGVAVAGLTVTPDTSGAATGSLLTDTPTTAGYSANNRVRPGDLVEIVLADADSSGAIRVGIEFVPTQYTVADTTDPGTRTTGDPRGTYEPILTEDGSEIIVGMVCDSAYNASGNGGLHGVRHYVP